MPKSWSFWRKRKIEQSWVEVLNSLLQQRSFFSSWEQYLSLSLWPSHQFSVNLPPAAMEFYFLSKVLLILYLKLPSGSPVLLDWHEELLSAPCCFLPLPWILNILRLFFPPRYSLTTKLFLGFLYLNHILSSQKDWREPCRLFAAFSHPFKESC